MESIAGPDLSGLDRAIRGGRLLGWLLMGFGLVLAVGAVSASAVVPDPASILIVGLGSAGGIALGGLMAVNRVHRFSRRLQRCEWHEQRLVLAGGIGNRMVQYRTGDGEHLAALEWSPVPRMKWMDTSGRPWWAYEESPDRVVISTPDGSSVGRFRCPRNAAEQQRLQWCWDRVQAKSLGTALPPRPRSVRLYLWVGLIATPVSLGILYTLDRSRFALVAIAGLVMGGLAGMYAWSERRSR